MRGPGAGKAPRKTVATKTPGKSPAAKASKKKAKSRLTAPKRARKYFCAIMSSIPPNAITSPPMPVPNHHIPCEERYRNEFFRGGDHEHVFEFGSSIVPAWRRLSELAVLVQRVKHGVKPFALFVVTPQSAIERENVVDRLQREGLAARGYRNPWGMHVVVFARDPDITLSELAPECDVQAFCAVEPEYDRIMQQRLGHYIDPGAPDLASGHSPLECGLVYGYVLEHTFKLYSV